MTDKTRQIAIALIALAVLAMLWLLGNDKNNADEGAAVPASEALQGASADAARGIPRNGTLDPISIDPARPADRLPVYQADTILQDYRDNRDSADQRYRGAYFIVEGVASGIRRDSETQVYLEIRTGDTAQPVRANLLQRQICGPAGRVCEVEARATMVRRGQKVAVECTGAGLADGTPVLDGCLLRGGAN
jgi:tRNA_anti-like